MQVCTMMASFTRAAIRGSTDVLIVRSGEWTTADRNAGSGPVTSRSKCMQRDILTVYKYSGTPYDITDMYCFSI